MARPTAPRAVLKDVKFLSPPLLQSCDPYFVVNLLGHSLDSDFPFSSP